MKVLKFVRVTLGENSYWGNKVYATVVEEFVSHFTKEIWWKIREEERFKSYDGSYYQTVKEVYVSKNKYEEEIKGYCKQLEFAKTNNYKQLKHC